MKKSYLIMAAIASVALASCSNEEFLGENDPGTGQSAIQFITGNRNMTRAEDDPLTGADAAKALNYAFVVGGYKGAQSVATNIVFDNYNVAYPQTASESNTTGWEYVGLDVNPLAATIPHETTDKQSIKYWDYSQAQYDFIAYSLGSGGATATSINPAHATEKPTTENPEYGAYTITGDIDGLKTVHIADLKTVLKASYSEAVTIEFRSLVAKVRVGLYETIPGYSVKDVQFYSAEDGSASTDAVLYTTGTATLPKSGTYTVYFPTVNDATPASDKNKAHVTFKAAATQGTQTNLTFGALTSNYTGAAHHEETGNVYLGRQSNQSTFAGLSSNQYYTQVLPNEESAALTLRVNYTLVSLDGSGETITVKGAKAVVPAIYTAWLPNYAYTYIFKISDNTNGWTDAINTSTEGLHPITFDAVVVQTEDADHVQETVTTVSTPSITTYQATPHVNASANNEYKAGTVYAMVMDGGTLKTDLNGTTSPAKDAAKLFSLSRAATEAEVMDALNMYTSNTSGNYTGLNGLVLTAGTIDNEIADEDIPGPDGNLIEVADGAASKLTVAASGNDAQYYAYVYTVTQATSNPTEEYRPIPVETGASVTAYYTYDSEKKTYTTATGTAAAGTTYYAKYSKTNQVYAVKVIRVVP